MALVNQSITSLVNGISQQPAILRLQSQCEAQENCLSSAVDGVRRRPPTVHIAKVASGDFSRAGFHLIDRDANEKYAVVLLDGDMRVFDLKTGAERTVAFPDGKAYLQSANPSRGFKAVTVADNTFLVNRAVVTGMTPDRSPQRPPDALIFVRAADYRERFTIKLDSQYWVLETPKAVTEDQARIYLNTDIIAAALGELLTTGTVAGAGAPNGAVLSVIGTSGAATGFSVSVQGSVIYIWKPSGVDFNLSVSSGSGGDHLVGIKGSVQRFSDLPRDGVDGFVVKVQGDPEQEGADYYVQYVKQLTTPTPASPPTGGNAGTTDSGSGDYGGVTSDWTALRDIRVGPFNQFI